MKSPRSAAKVDTMLYWDVGLMTRVILSSSSFRTVGERAVCDTCDEGAFPYSRSIGTETNNHLRCGIYEKMALSVPIATDVDGFWLAISPGESRYTSETPERVDTRVENAP